MDARKKDCNWTMPEHGKEAQTKGGFSVRSLSFFASGIPKGQPRPRAFARKFGNQWQARVFDAGTAEGWKAQVALAFKESVGVAGATTLPMVGPVRIQISFRFPRPKNHFNKGGVLRDKSPQYHTSRPDIENCEKAVLDALTQLGAWRDDSQVCILHSEKLYADEPGAQVIVTEFQGGQE
jgi:Holliday junction resolvase RusA-like endonuclease